MAPLNNLQASTGPRLVSFVLGIWLFLSAFIWPHSASSQTNTWIVGILIAAAALWAMYNPAARFANTVLAIWLFVSTWFIYHVTVGTLWNNLIVAVVVFVASLIQSGAGMTTGRPQRQVPA